MKFRVALAFDRLQQMIYKSFGKATSRRIQPLIQDVQEPLQGLCLSVLPKNEGNKTVVKRTDSEKVYVEMLQ